jgi:hypothetical protein
MAYILMRMVKIKEWQRQYPRYKFLRAVKGIDYQMFGKIIAVLFKHQVRTQ